ncbi:2-phosphosulfolactate phosphatase [Bradyrhizobium genosp. P]|uniref:2-phosphosulfolactate phosphatase n=1 Tax=Bradyrhizobium genosp. P TaxID=83641 RepID=UPI003CF816D2
MKIQSVNIEYSHEATGVAVVIDVLRAFTTAAYAFDRGAQDIVLAAKVDDALALKKKFAGSLIMGEVATLAVPEFDFSNSTAEIAGQNLAGRRLIHRTSNGTQGVHRSVNAMHLVATGFPTARATADYVGSLEPSSVTFIITGITNDRDGDEDQACADYIAALLNGDQPDPKPYIDRVIKSDVGRWFTDPAKPEYPLRDLELATAVNMFGFAMPVSRQADLLIMRKSEGV